MRRSDMVVGEQVDEDDDDETVTLRLTARRRLAVAPHKCGSLALAIVGGIVRMTFIDVDGLLF